MLPLIGFSIKGAPRVSHEIWAADRSDALVGGAGKGTCRMIRYSSQPVTSERSSSCKSAERQPA